MKIAVMVNRYAGRGRNARTFRKFDDPDISLYQVEALERYGEIIDAIARKGTDLVVLVGGDGTFHRFVNAFLQRFGCEVALPRLAVLHGGSANVVSENLGFRRHPIDDCTWIVQRARGDCSTLPIITKHLLAIDDTRYGKRHYASMFTNGVLDRVLREMYSATHGGAWNVFTTFTNAMMQARFGWRQRSGRIFGRESMRIELDGDTLPFEEYFGAFCAIFPRTVLRLPVFGDLPEDPKRFFCAIGAQSAADVAKTLPLMSVGRYPSDPRFVRGVFQKVCIEARGGYALDGELAETSPTPFSLTITQGPAVRFLTRT